MRKAGKENEETPILKISHYNCAKSTDGLTIRQVWEQAGRILDAASNEVRVIATQDVQGDPITDAIDSI